MSGVYIKGMTAPRSCAECLDIGWNYVFECNLDDVESGEKRADCPLLTAPGHGRLIDADKLMDALPDDFSIPSTAAKVIEKTIIPTSKEDG